jgi:exopolysaccharide production protein ExoY
MANDISSPATRREERLISNSSWRTVTSTDADHGGWFPDGGLPHKIKALGVKGRDARPAVVGGGAKRCFDIVGALIAIAFMLPLFCLVALAIKLWDRGPVLYRHRRVGLNGITFDCLKFRSMVVNADEVLSRYLTADSKAAGEWREARKLRRDPRITPLGAGMRRTSIDELPQLLNILKGEMSFVGPRPIVTAEVPKYGAAIDHYLRARPGLTGPWQVSGRNDVNYATRIALDRGYVETWSFGRDLAIIAKTVRVVIVAHGCY